MKTHYLGPVQDNDPSKRADHKIYGSLSRVCGSLSRKCPFSVLKFNMTYNSEVPTHVVDQNYNFNVVVARLVYKSSAVYNVHIKYTYTVCSFVGTL